MTKASALSFPSRTGRSGQERKGREQSCVPGDQCRSQGQQQRPAIPPWPRAAVIETGERVSGGRMPQQAKRYAHFDLPTLSWAYPSHRRKPGDPVNPNKGCKVVN